MKLKKTALFFMLTILYGSLGICAQTKIVTGHPDFKIKITRCEANGSTAVIDMLLENESPQDVKLTLKSYATAAYDDEGNKYSDGKIKLQFGNSSWMEGKQGNSPISNLLPSEIPMKAHIQIDGIPESATMFKRIDLGVSCSEWNLKEDKFVKFTNVPISREGDD